MFRQHAINRPQALLGLHGTIIAALRALTRNLVDPYRPERHYMRGPGPKCREKAALALQAQHQERLPPFSWIGGTNMKEHYAHSPISLAGSVPGMRARVGAPRSGFRLSIGAVMRSL